jgi:hypothetical protein
MQLALFDPPQRPGLWAQIGEWLVGERDDLPAELRRAPDLAAPDDIDPEILIPVDSVVLAYIAKRGSKW